MPVDPAPAAPGLESRVRALEERVATLESALGPATLEAPTLEATLGAPSHPAAPPAPPEEAERSAASAPAASAPAVDPFWALKGLKQTCGDAGGVVYAGYVTEPTGGRLDWQYARPGDYLAAQDFAASAAPLAALASPVRLSLLQAVRHGAHSVAELAATGEFGTTGQIYHHLNQLAAAGWLESPRRGLWVIPPDRVIPLLTIILATQG